MICHRYQLLTMKKEIHTTAENVFFISPARCTYKTEMGATDASNNGITAFQLYKRVWTTVKDSQTKSIWCRNNWQTCEPPRSHSNTHNEKKKYFDDVPWLLNYTIEAYHISQIEQREKITEKLFTTLYIFSLKSRTTCPRGCKVCYKSPFTHEHMIVNNQNIILRRWNYVAELLGR